jgi:nicotinamide-nucleotide amidase
MLYNKLGKIDKIEKYAKVAFLPNLKGVRIRLTASESGKQKPLDLLDKAEKLIRDKVDDYIYADQDIPLEHVVGKLLENQSATLAVAESCTGGLVGHRLTNIAGSSAYFGYGIVSYSNDAKVKTINVPPGLFEKHGAVSPQVASAMASGVRNLAKSTFGLSTTGIAGPTGGTKNKPVGLVYIGFASDERIVVEKYNFADDRICNKIRISQAALELVRRQILLINR